MTDDPAEQAGAHDQILCRECGRWIAGNEAQETTRGYCCAACVDEIVERGETP